MVSAAIAARARSRRPARSRYGRGPAVSRFISAAIGASLATARSTSAVLKVENCAPPNSLQHLGLGCVGQRRVDADQVVGLGTRLEPRLLARQRLRIGLRLADLLRDRVGVVGQVDARIVGRIRLRHLLGAVAQGHDARRRALDHRLGEREERVAEAVRVDRLGEIVVELLRDVAAELEMLLLVLADRHMGRAIDQDVGRHQARIGEQPDRGVLAVLAGLLLELGHAVEPAHAGDAVEHPGELGVLGAPGSG